MSAPKCSYYTKNPTTGRDEQVCAEPVAEVWVERSSEEDEHGVSNPMRRHWCEGHGAKGELRKKKRLERVKEYPQLADDGLQYAIILKQFEVLPYGKMLPARTDEDRTAKPKTRLLQRVVDHGQCIVTGPATHVEDTETGKRLELHDTPARRTDGTPEG
ncbi:MAG: hypothetical protein OK454_02905 [Thaumarchaeota archaeon]|nr:hypothetical protein [Nitrososphaerota archaeon]